MSKRVLLLTLAVLMAVGIYTAVAEAGVEGDFTFDIWMWPQTTTAEAAKFDIDFEALLNLDVTVSGLTIGNRAALGIAGLEHYILTLTTTLGALDMSDTFAFAAPYIGCPRRAPAKYWYIDFFYAYPAFTGCHPVGDLMFVKKRVSLAMTIGGLTVDTLIMFEDVNFPAPTDSDITAVDTDSDGIYEPSEQKFNFGAILGISGTTVSGIEITAKSGFCADWSIFLGYYGIGKYGGWGFIPDYAPNDIKKYRWYESVCEEGTLYLTKEFIAIENVNLIPGLTLNNYIIMQPSPGFQFVSYIEGIYTLPMDLGTLFTWFQWLGGIELVGPSLNAVYLAMDNLEILWYDLDGDLTMSANDEVTAAFSFDLQAASVLFQTLYVPTLGIDRVLVEVDLPISYPEPIGTLEITSLWAAPQAGAGVVWDAVDFHLSKAFGEHNTFMIDAQFDSDGLRAVEIEIGVSFSL